MLQGGPKFFSLGRVIELLFYDLQMKLDYMVKRNMLGSTEEFISKAATASSVSGEPYQIRCGSQAPVASAAWLTAELKRIRSS